MSTSVVERWFGPVAVYELTAAGRSRSLYVARTVVALCLLGLLFTQYRQFAEPVDDLRMLPYVGQALFAFVALAQFFVLFLAVPAITADVFAADRRRGVFDLLFTSPLTAGEIVLGKVVGRAAVVLQLLAAGLPILYLTILFGGVSAETLFYTELAAVMVFMIYLLAAVRISAAASSPVTIFFKILLVGIGFALLRLFLGGAFISTTGRISRAAYLIGWAFELGFYVVVLLLVASSWLRNAAASLQRSLNYRPSLDRRDGVSGATFENEPVLASLVVVFVTVVVVPLVILVLILCVGYIARDHGIG
ncbi:MAG: ABC transporter permease, partial [Planctomycetia bacterium]